MKNRFSILLIFVLMPLFLQAFSLFEKEAPESREGRKKYAVGEMEEAEKEFDKAAKRLENNAEAYYDLGNALQSQQKFEEALSAYQKSLETGKTTENLRSKIFHNMGNSFAGLGKYQDAEKFYMKSLEEEPSKESAENLEIVRRIIAQQKEQDQQKNEDQENQDQQDQENKEQNQEQQDQEEKEKQDEKEQNENPDNEQKDEQNQESAEQNDENNKGNDDEQNSGMHDEDNETQDEENQSAAAEEQDDEQQNDDKPKESSVLKQFKQRKNLQISPFMLKKEQKSDNGQTW